MALVQLQRAITAATAAPAILEVVAHKEALKEIATLVLVPLVVQVGQPIATHGVPMVVLVGLVVHPQDAIQEITVLQERQEAMVVQPGVEAAPKVVEQVAALLVAMVLEEAQEVFTPPLR